MRWTLLVVAVFLLCLPERPWGQTTAPTISSVSGTPVSGTSITINGSLLVNEDTSHYDAWFTTHPHASGMEGASPSADGWWDSGLHEGVYVTDVKLTGPQSGKLHLAATGSSQDAGEAFYFTPTLTNYYLRAYLRLHRNSATGWPLNQFKLIGQYGSDVKILAPARNEWPTEWNMYYGGSNHWYNNPFGNIVADRWFCVEWYMSSSAWTVWIDGVQLGSGGTGATGGWLEFGIFDTDGPSGLSMDAYYDNMATGSARLYPLSTVEIGNSATYATATKRYQAPTLLSDGQVQVTCDLTGLGSGPYYLWVTNNRQQRSAAIPLSATSAPAAPSNVVIR